MLITENKGYQAALASCDEKLPAELKAAILAAVIKQCEEAMAATQVAKANLAAAMDARSKAFKAMNECVKRN